MPTSRFALAALFVALAGSSAQAQAIAKGSIVVDLESFAALPNTSNAPARANVLRPAPAGRIFVNDPRGYLYLLGAGGITVTQCLNLPSYGPVLNDNGERGFQSFAFHPDFNTPGAAGYGKFYTMTSQTDTTKVATFVPGNGARDHDEVLLEWTVADPAASTFAPANSAAPFREVLRIARPAGNHNAGYISFNPTATTAAERGNLYFGVGDSGGGGDPLNLAQTLNKAYGAVLRINPLVPAAGTAYPSANGQYSVPSDNPYYTGKTTFLPEKFAAGFRNPQRFTWDSANGRMFVADIGQNLVEEIDVCVAGANYGWNQREGSFVYNSNGTDGANVRSDAATTGFTYPIAEYAHYSSAGNGVTTGPVFRDGRIPALNGRLIFSDFVNGVPYTLDAVNLPNGGSTGITELRLRSNGTETTLLNLVKQTNSAATRVDLRYGTDAAGNVYFLNKQDGIIRRIVPAGRLAFFSGVQAQGGGVDYLQFPSGKPFGYFSFLSDPNYLYHYDLGYEYVFDATDGQSGVYLYDFRSSTFFYTSPSFPFPYLYDFSLGSVVYYFPDPSNPQRYNTNGVRYFYVFNTGQIISK